MILDEAIYNNSATFRNIIIYMRSVVADSARIGAGVTRALITKNADKRSLGWSKSEAVRGSICNTTVLRKPKRGDDGIRCNRDYASFYG